MSTPNDPYGRAQDPKYPGPQPYGQPDYGQAAYGQPYGVPPQHPGQQFGVQPYPGYPPAAQGELQDPDNAMGIVGLILSVAACSPAGLIVSWIALKKSKQRGYKNTPALIGAIMGAVFTALAVLAIVGYIAFIVLMLGAAAGTS